MRPLLITVVAEIPLLRAAATVEVGDGYREMCVYKKV